MERHIANGSSVRLPELYILTPSTYDVELGERANLRQRENDIYSLTRVEVSHIPDLEFVELC